MFFDNVSNLCKDAGISISKLALELNISKSNVTNWKNGSVPKSNVVQKIADYFDVSTDYLLGKTDIKKGPEAYGFEPGTKDYELMKKYLDLPPDKKKEAERYLDYLLSLEHSND